MYHLNLHVSHQRFCGYIPNDCPRTLRMAPLLVPWTPQGFSVKYIRRSHVDSSHVSFQHLLHNRATHMSSSVHDVDDTTKRKHPLGHVGIQNMSGTLETI